MDNLNRRSADELVCLHNGRCAVEDRIEGPWKKSKRKLIDRIRALGEPVAFDHQVTATESAEVDDVKTIGALVESLVVTDLAYGDIVRMVRNRFPDARTTARSVASVASARRRRGASAPLRRGANALERQKSAD